MAHEPLQVELTRFGATSLEIAAAAVIEAQCTERSKISDLIDRAASDRSYDGDLIDDIRDILDGRVRFSGRRDEAGL